MIRIQSNNPRRIQTGGINPGNQPVLRTASGRAEDKTLADMLQSGMKLTDTAVKEYISRETARVSQSLQQMNAELAAEHESYMRKNQGQEALSAEEDFDRFARNLVDRHLADGKFQGRFAEAFLQQAAGTALHFAEQGRSYAGQQRAAWQDSLLKGEISHFQNQISRDCDNKDWIEFNLVNLVQRVESMRPGQDNRALLEGVRRDGAEGVIDGFLASGRMDDARGAFAQYRDMLGDRAEAIRARIDARADALQAREEARRKKAEQAEARGAVRSAVRGILNESAELPSLEEQRNFALTRAEAVEDPDLRQKARAEIEQELDWRMLRRDARLMRAMLDFRNAARSEGLSPEQRRERLEQEDMPEDVRTALFDELERGQERVPDADNMARAMNLLRFIDAARAGGRAPTTEDILAAGLRGGLTDGQVEGALAYLENDTLSLSRLDDICLDLGMAPDEHGEVRAPAWLYEGVLRDLARNGQSGNGIITDEVLAKSATRVRQRHDARIAALNKAGVSASWEMVPEIDPDVNSWAQGVRERYINDVPEDFPDIEKDSTLQERGRIKLEQYHKFPDKYDTGADYYQIGRRPLDIFLIGEGFFTEKTLLSNNIRWEHQQFLGNDNSNFGFMGDGKVREDIGRQSEYSMNIPRIGSIKYKGKYIRMARDILDEDWINQKKESINSVLNKKSKKYIKDDK